MVPALLGFAALFLAGCAASSQKPSEAIPKKPPPGNSPEPDYSPPNPVRVQIFENLGIEDFKRSLPEKPGKSEILGQLAAVIAGGDPKRVDPGEETLRVARIFAETQEIFYPSSSPFTRVRHQDLYAYEMINREEFKKRFQIETVQHPFVKILDRVSLYRMERFRGLPAFDRLADILPEKVAQVKQSRSLNVLYPGSGSHIAPLLTALKLIDASQVDRASFTYTELEPSNFGALVELMGNGIYQGVFEKLSVGPEVTFPGEGSERTIEVSYKGKPVQIVFALHRSGKKYYREEYFEKADLVILHDPGIGYPENSFELLADLLLTKKNSPFSKKNQLVIMEGTPDTADRNSPEEDVSSFPAGMDLIRLPGPYGHCHPFQDYGEISDCKSDFARAFLLNDPALTSLIQQYGDASKLSRALFKPGMRVQIAPSQ